MAARSRLPAGAVTIRPTTLREPTAALPCPNPFCDGHGNIDVSVNVSGRSRTYNTCGIGPHPAPVYPPPNFPAGYDSIGAWRVRCGGCGWPLTWAWHSTEVTQHCRNCVPMLTA